MKKIIILAVMISLLSRTLYSADTKIPENLKLYAYMMLLFNENVHLVNKIETEKITVNELFQNESVNHTRFIKYMNSINDMKIRLLAQGMFEYFKDRNSFTPEKINTLAKSLEDINILVKFNINNNSGNFVDYLLFGKREKLTTRSPFFKDEVDYYNIIPFLHYDDLTTSSVTIYPNCIYINMREAAYDHKVFLDILSGKNSIAQYLGVSIDDNIRCAVKKAYPVKKCSINDVRRLSESLLLGMQIAREKLNIKELPLSRAFGITSAIYDSPYEGLILLFAYLQYDKKTDYAVSAKSFVKFVSDKTGNKLITEDPSILCSMGKAELKNIADEYYLYLIKNGELY